MVIQFGVLGPVTVHRSGVPVALGAAKVRCLLAVLLGRPGQPVPVDDLVEALWDAHPPPGARKAIQVYVHRLRSAIGEDQRIGYEPAGYTVVVERDELDALRFVMAGERGTGCWPPTR